MTGWDSDFDVGWPKRGIRIFQAGNGLEMQFNTAINWLDDNLSHYAHSYYRAAAVLLTHEQASALSGSQLAQPICFLVRHYLELQLKLLIREAREALCQHPAQTLGHRLTPLWDTLQAHLLRIPKHWDREDHDALRERLVEIDRHDPNAEAFRYPTSTTGHPTLEDLPCVNLVYLHDALERLREFLKAVQSDIERYTRLKRNRRKKS